MMVNLKPRRESNAIDALRKKTLSASYVLPGWPENFNIPPDFLATYFGSPDYEITVYSFPENPGLLYYDVKRLLSETVPAFCPEEEEQKYSSSSSARNTAATGFLLLILYNLKGCAAGPVGCVIDLATFPGP